MTDNSNILPNDQNRYRAAGFESSTTPGELHAGQIIVATGRIKVDSAGAGSGTVTEVDTGTGLTGGPITTTGTISLDTKLAPMDSLTGNSLKVLRVNAGETAVEYVTPSSGTVTSVSGTTNRITVATGTTTPVIDIAATYVGQTSITTLGTVTTGTLSTGAIVGGVTMTLGSDGTGDIYYRNSSGVLTRLAIGSSTNVLTVSGGLPAWSAAPAASIVVGTTTITSGTNTRILYDNSGVVGEYTLTGTGTVVVMATSPTLVTPVLGVATATSINKMAITAPATSSTLAVADGKTLTFNNSITLAGTDSTTMTFPSTTATIARTDAAQTFTGTQTFSQIVTTSNAITASGNAATVPITSRISTVTNNSAATLTITITTTSAVDGQMVMVRVLDASAVAQTITWVNTENSTVSVPVTSNGSTTLPLTVGFQFNTNTTKWRCIASA